MDLNGIGALVAGGASGLGEATARELAARGARVAILDLNEERGPQLAEELGGLFTPADVTDEERVSAAVEDAAEAFGGLRLAVSCAGIGWAERTVGRDGPAKLAPFETVVRVNLIGTFNVLRLSAAAMAQNEPGEDGERGAVVMTASIAAFDGQIGQTAYSASKGGVVGPDAAGGARSGPARHPRLHDRAGPVRHAAARRPARRGARGARRADPVPVAARTPRGVRAARLPDRRERDAERRGAAPRRRAADAAALARRK